MNRFLIGCSFILITCSLLFSCVTCKIAKIDNGSLVAISATSSGFGAKGYGIGITLVNIETKEEFKSKSISLMSSHSIIQNVPAGTYIVKKIVVPVGNIIYSNWSDSVRAFFGQIEIKPNSKYYLGNFSGTRKT